MGKVVSPYLFGMTNPHERNRYCNNSSAKDEPGVGLSIPEPTKYISGSKRVQHYKFTGGAISLTASHEDRLSAANARRARRRN
jgi:hypothetical protein